MDPQTDEERVAALLEQLETPGLDPNHTAQIVEEINTLRGRPTHPGAVPNPSGAMIYTDETGAIATPHRPVHVMTKDPRLQLPHEPRAAHVQTAEEQIATVRQDLEGRMQELEEMLDTADLAEPTRATILAEISRLREMAP